MPETNDHYPDEEIDKILENIPEELELREDFQIYLWDQFGNTKNNDTITRIIFKSSNETPENLIYPQELLKNWINSLQLKKPNLYIPALKILTGYLKRKNLKYDGEAINRFLG